MDDGLRTLERRARAAPDDRTLARALRAGLERAAGDPDATRRLEALHGALCSPSAIGDDEDPDDPRAARWRLAAVGGEPPLLRPALVQGATERWRAPGRALWVSAGLVILEAPGGALEGRDARSGEVRWRVPSVGPARLVEHDEAARSARVGWAAAPWGAVEVGARWEADLQVRRAGRWTPEGRTTEREVAGRGAVRVEVALQVALAPGGAWSGAPPRTLVERPAPGAPLLDGDLALARWEDDLLALALDPRAPRFALAWRDDDQDWAVYEAGLAPDGAPWAGPAGWSAPAHEDPIGLEASPVGDDGATPEPCRAALRELHAGGGGMRALEVRAGHPVAGRLELAGRGAEAALALDDAVLVRGAVDGRATLAVARAPGGALADAADLLPADVARDELELRFWDEPDAAHGSAAVLLPAPGLLVVQAGRDVVALAP